MGQQSKLYIAEVNEKLGAVKAASTGLTSASDGYTNEWIAVGTKRNANQPIAGARDRLEKLMKSVVSGETKALDALKEADSSLKKFESFLILKAKEWSPLHKKSLGSCQQFVTDSRAEFVKLKKEIDLKLVAKHTKASFDDGITHRLF